ncbi:hypothetical protein HYZ05_00225 [Candidatus Daviesbacteria bacterium]|nr:hypothetical protein [Candidatus Daviesbacteria bacterium]
MAKITKITKKPNKFIFPILFESGTKQLEFQSGAVESMEAKTGYLIAGEGVVLTILTTFATQAKDFKFNLWIYLGITLLGSSLLFCIIVLWNRHLKIGIGIKDFYESYVTKTQNEIRFRALNLLNYNYEVNQKVIEKKSAFFQLALVTLAISLLLLVIGLLNQVYVRYNEDMKNKLTPINSNQIQNDGRQNSTTSAKPASESTNWRWYSSNQSLGTISADVIKENGSFIKK